MARSGRHAGRLNIRFHRWPDSRAGDRRPHREPVCARATTVATRRGMAVSRDAGRVRTAISMSGGVGGLEAEKGFLHHGSAPAGRGEGPGPVE
jgi:hypothetical protein